MVLDGFMVTSSDNQENQKTKNNQKAVISKCQSMSELSSHVPCAMLMPHIISLNHHHKPRLWARYRNASYFVGENTESQRSLQLSHWGCWLRSILSPCALGQSGSIACSSLHVSSYGYFWIQPFSPQSGGAPYLIHPSFSLSLAVRGEKRPSPQNGRFPG